MPRMNSMPRLSDLRVSIFLNGTADPAGRYFPNFRDSSQEAFGVSVTLATETPNTSSILVLISEYFRHD
jgi:hypothetical protein